MQIETLSIKCETSLPIAYYDKEAVGQAIAVEIATLLLRRRCSKTIVTVERTYEDNRTNILSRIVMDSDQPGYIGK